MLLVFYLFINTTSSVEDRSCSDSTIIYTVLILHFHSVCANKRSMHLSYWCSYGFSGDPSSIKMARVGRGSDEDQQQCPCAEKIKTSVLILQTANQLENSLPPSSPSSQKKSTNIATLLKAIQVLVPTSPISPWSFLKLLGAPSHWLTCCICKMPSSPTWMLALTSAWNLCQI